MNQNVFLFVFSAKAFRFCECNHASPVMGSGDGLVGLPVCSWKEPDLHLCYFIEPELEEIKDAVSCAFSLLGT